MSGAPICVVRTLHGAVNPREILRSAPSNRPAPNMWVVRRRLAIMEGMERTETHPAFTHPRRNEVGAA